MIYIDSPGDKLFDSQTEEEFLISYSKRYLRAAARDWKHETDFILAGTAKEKVRVVQNFIEKSKLDIKIDVVHSPKNNDNSKTLQTNANRLLSDKKFDEALTKFNEAICYAEAGSETLGIAYQKRAEIYYDKKLYTNCLNNLQLAKENKFPDDLHFLLKARQDACEKQLKMRKTRTNFPPRKEYSLSYPGDKKIPFMAECLEMKRSKKFGKGIYTTKDLHVGDVVTIEDTLVHTLSIDYMFSRCNYCSKENHKDLIPCRNCTKVMFCSNACCEKANEEFHQYECRFIDGLMSVKQEYIFLMFRLLIIAHKAFPTVQKHKEFYQALNPDIIHNLKIDYANATPKSIYKAVAGLKIVKNLEKAQILTMELSVSTLYKLILRDDELKLRYETAADKDFLYEILVHHCEVLLFSMLKIQSIPTIDDFETFQFALTFKSKVGCGVYPISPIVNHSCSPNVVYILSGRRNLLFVLKPIKAGEQLLSNYGAHFMLKNKERRQEKIRGNWDFECICVACENNWGDVHSITRVPTYTDPRMDKVFENIRNYQNKSELKLLYETLEANVRLHPDERLYMLENNLINQWTVDNREYDDQ